ncbi:MAG TPA: FtsX-like permease family protein, partial [Coriobacteriia bacterium]|nr:FtsX-like permease family protein [Coriobacteriia bacterium]
MSLVRIALRDISRSGFRSAMVFLCATLLAGFILGITLVTQGANDSLSLTQERLGADIMVVPQGAEAGVENALLAGGRTSVWMPTAHVEAIRSLPGVAAASPQMYLASLAGASCCSVGDMFIIAFDPSSDFTVQPWLEQRLGQGLSAGETLGGTHVSVPPGEQGLTVYGYPVTLAATLEPTGGSLDQSLFMTFETAREIAAGSATAAEAPLEIPADSVSSVLVRVADGADPVTVAGAILTGVPDVSVVLRPSMFGFFRERIAALESALGVILALGATVAVLLIGVVFALAAHERRREIGVWRALGATRTQVASTFVAQAAVLAAAGGLAGALFGAFVTYLFQDYIISRV